jgi:hypothetical protein
MAGAVLRARIARLEALIVKLCGKPRCSHRGVGSQ